MSYRHQDRAWKLSLHPTQKYIMLALALHANEKNDMCWPSVERLVELTGFNKKTIYRGLKKLEEIGLIKIDKTRKYNTYTLYISGDLESITRYLKFYDEVFKFQDVEPDCIKKDSGSPELLKENIKLNDNENKKLSLCASAYSGGTLPAKQEEIKGKQYEQLIQPFELWASLEKTWKDNMKLIFEEDEFKFTCKDRWNLESFKELMDKKEYPPKTIINRVLDTWKAFCSYVQSSTGKHSMKCPTMPSTDFLLKYANYSVKFAFGDADEEDY